MYVKIDWSTRLHFKKKRSTHKQNHILYKSLHFSNSNVKLQQNPMTYPNTQMRQNVICQQLKLEPFIVDFLQIILFLHQKMMYIFLNAKQFLT